MSADENSIGPDPHAGQDAAAATSVPDGGALPTASAATSSPEEVSEAPRKQLANATPTPPAHPAQAVAFSNQPSGLGEPRDVSIWLIPVCAIVLIAGAGKLGGVFWGAAALTLVVTIAVAVVVNTTFPEHRKQFAVAVGILVGIALMFILMTQRPDILTPLGIPTPSTPPSPAVSPTATR